MALFKVCRCKESNILTEINDGYVYFCIDTGNLYIDWADETGALYRSHISSDHANSLRFLFDGEFTEIGAMEVYNHVNDKGNPHEISFEKIGAVPITRSINGKQLDEDINLIPEDIGAANASVEQEKLSKSGDKMQGTLDMGGQTLTGIKMPVNNSDAVPMEYVDENIKKTHDTFAVTIPENSWVGTEAPYTSIIAVVKPNDEDRIYASDTPHITPAYSGELPEKLAQQEAWGNVNEAEALDGEIKFTCFSGKPAVDIPIQIEVNR